MKMSSLLMTQRILLINWVIAPALGIWIWVKSGFFSAALFIIIWLIIDKVWDWLTELLMANVARIGANEEEAFEMEITGEVPARIASMMVVDLLGTLVLPWIIAGLFLFGSTSGSNNEHIAASLRYYSDVTKIINEEHSLVFSVEKSNEITTFYKKALAEANLVNIQELKNYSEKFALHYTQEFMEGLKLSIEGFDTVDIGKSLRGQALLEEFRKWYFQEIVE